VPGLFMQATKRNRGGLGVESSDRNAKTKLPDTAWNGL
jgi:hypothetical protein